MPAFSADIRRYRRRAGMTQRDLARSLGVTVMSIKNWEAGRYAPSRLEELMMTLGLTQAEREEMRLKVASDRKA